MHISYSSLLGIVFLGLALAATFTMFQFWGHDYDEVKKKSSCPQWKMNIHRAIGFAYILVYILMMTEMVPRLWEYQVEFPPRTVAHILLGTAIGVILLIKVSILRFFRHFEEWMPALGVSLLMCSVLLGAMSLPAFFQERQLAAGALGGSVYSPENRDRVAALLPEAGYPEGVEISELSTERSLEQGRRVLLGKCVACHDLKTIIAKPRTPSDWVRTSKRMVEKPTLGVTISADEGRRAAAYLIAITPDLQRSAKEKRKAQIVRGESQKAADELLVNGEAEVGPGVDAGVESPEVESPVVETPVKPETRPEVKPEPKPEPKAPAKAKPAKPKYDFKAAKALFDEECSLCHGTSDVDDAPPTSRKEVNQMLSRMIDNGLDLEKDDLALIRFYLIKTYLKK
jgi:mono/diheme cytochrome c family protein